MSEWRHIVLTSPPLDLPSPRLGARPRRPSVRRIGRAQRHHARDCGRHVCSRVYGAEGKVAPAVRDVVRKDPRCRAGDVDKVKESIGADEAEGVIDNADGHRVQLKQTGGPSRRRSEHGGTGSRAVAVYADSIILQPEILAIELCRSGPGQRACVLVSSDRLGGEARWNAHAWTRRRYSVWVELDHWPTGRGNGPASTVAAVMTAMMRRAVRVMDLIMNRQYGVLFGWSD